MNDLRRRSIFTLFVTLGLSGCAPIALPQLPITIPLPQVFQPQQAGVVAIPRQQPQAAQSRPAIPEAGALTAAPAAIARAAVPAPARAQPRVARAAVPAPARVQLSQARTQSPRARAIQPPPRVAPAQAYRQAQQIAVPPVLNPVQQARISRPANQRNYQASAGVMRAPAPEYRSQQPIRNQQPIWEDQSNTVTSARKKTSAVRRPSASVRKPAAPVARKKPAAKKPEQKKRNTARASARKKVVKAPEPEVLDLSSSLQKNTVTKQPAVPAPAKRSYNNSPAVVVLTKQANNQLTVGKVAGAAATLERALRIAPDNPLLWLRLAEVNARQGKKSQAVSMARKALSLAPGDTGIQVRGQRLIK